LENKAPWGTVLRLLHGLFVSPFEAAITGWQGQRLPELSAGHPPPERAVGTPRERGHRRRRRSGVSQAPNIPLKRFLSSPVILHIREGPKEPGSFIAFYSIL